MACQPHYDEEDSNHSINGWIKKEPEDFDYEEYENAHQEEEPTGVESFDELMNLSKYDLVGICMQLREDLASRDRILQTVGPDFQKTYLELRKTSEDLKRNVDAMSKYVGGALPKDTQPSSSVPSSSSVPRTVASSVSVSRPTNVQSTSQSSQYSSTPSATPRSAASATPRSSAPANQSSSTVNTVANNRVPGLSVSKQTVTITKEMFIKTEIPSPPPEPIVTNSMTNMQSNTQQVNNQRNQQFVQMQRQPQQAPNQKQQYSSRSITDIANSVPFRRAKNPPPPQQQQQQAYQNISSSPKKTTNRAMPQLQQQLQQQFLSQRQSQNLNLQKAQPPGGKATRGRTAASQRSVPYAVQRPPMNIRPAPPASSASGGNNVNMFGNLKVPAGITLSVLPTKAMEKPQNVDQTGAKSANNVGRLHNLQSQMEDGLSVVSSSNPSLSTSANAVSGTNMYMDEEDEEEDEEECESMEELAVLIPDKNPVGTDGNPDMSKALVAAPKNFRRRNWNMQQSAAMADPSACNNSNAEYMFEEADDIDSEEDSKVYLGEDVFLPKDLVTMCLQQGKTAVLLTKSLTNAFFPEKRELASAYVIGTKGRPTRPTLSENKVEAIVTLVRKNYPTTKATTIMSIMNNMCKEAKQHLGL